MPDNFLGGLELLIVAMIVVFLVLALIIAFVRLLNIFSRGRARTHDGGGDFETPPVVIPEPVAFVPETIGEPEQATAAPAPEPEVRDNDPDVLEGEVAQEVAVDEPVAGHELLAIITAAIVAHQGTPAAPFVVKSVSRAQDTNFDAWQLAGRQRLIDSRRMKLSRR